jgi:hypothetical protein
MDPVPDPLLKKSGTAGNWSRTSGSFSQELWPLEHRGGQGNTSVYRIHVSKTLLQKWLHAESIFFIYILHKIFAPSKGSNKIIT